MGSGRLIFVIALASDANIYAVIWDMLKHGVADISILHTCRIVICKTTEPETLRQIPGVVRIEKDKQVC